MRRTPLFAGVAMVTLAVGIGANAAIFTLVNAVVLRPLAYADAAQLVSLDTGNGQFGLAPAEYFELRTINHAFSAVGAYTMRDVNLSTGDRPLRVRAVFLDGELFRALRVRPVAGRLFTTTESEVTAPWYPGDEPPPADVAVISNSLWRTAFGGASVVGQRVTIDGRRRDIVGVLEPGADVGDAGVDVWVPLGLNPATRGFRGYHVLSVIARTRDGVTLAGAQADLNALMSNWAARVGLPRTAHVFSRDGQPYPHPLRMTPLQDAVVGHVTRSMWLLQGAVVVVLLIICANLGSLLMARAAARRHDVAVRLALGASRGRLLRQAVVEGAVLSVPAGIIGIAIAAVSVRAFASWYPDALPRLREVAIDTHVLMFSAAVSAVAAALFGLAPLAAQHGAFTVALSEGGGRTAGGGHPLRNALTVAQVAFAVVIIVAAGLLARTVYNLSSVNVGFDAGKLVTFSVAAPAANQSVGRVEVYQRVLDTLRAVPGVQSVSAMAEVPTRQRFDSEDTDVANDPAATSSGMQPVGYYQSVMSNYFETMGIPIVAGRSFRATDAASGGMVAIVNQRLAQTFWNGQNPIGQRLRPGWGPWVPWFTVIGVAADVRQAGADHEPGTEMYFFVDQMAHAAAPLGRTPPMMHFVLRTASSPAALRSAVEHAVHEADPTVPVVRLRAMDDLLKESIKRPRLLSTLLTVFAGLALILAAVGIYGLLAYVVAQRHREIGVRVAVGAAPSGIVRLIVGEGLRLTTVGVLAGLAMAVSVSRAMTSLLFGIAPTDPATLAAVVLLLMLVSAAACWVPARRATMFNPSDVLRAE